MSTVTIELTDEQTAAIENLKTKKSETVDKVCARILADVAVAPRGANGMATKAIMAPEWFHRLGSCFDRELAMVALGKEEVVASDTSRISTVRNSLGIAAFRRKGRPRKYLTDDRRETWTVLQPLVAKKKMIATAVLSALGFRSSGDALAWAKAEGLSDLEALIQGSMRKPRTKTRKAKKDETPAPAAE